MNAYHFDKGRSAGSTSADGPSRLPCTSPTTCSSPEAGRSRCTSTTGQATSSSGPSSTRTRQPRWSTGGPGGSGRRSGHRRADPNHPRGTGRGRDAETRRLRQRRHAAVPRPERHQDHHPARLPLSPPCRAHPPTSRRPATQKSICPSSTWSGATRRATRSRRITTSPTRRDHAGSDGGSAATRRTATIIAAWATAVAAEATGFGARLHHDALIEHGPPLWVGWLAFLLAWQVMVAAMMLPSSLPLIRMFGVAAQGQARRELR